MGSPSVAQDSKPRGEVAGFPWNQWQPSYGIGGSFGMESVATFVWNRRQLCRGISGRFGVEYAKLQERFCSRGIMTEKSLCRTSRT
jgi:hypothetical protein